MIHSLSGGVIAENGLYTFVKVNVAGTPCWYVTEEKAETGDTALVPYGKNGSLVRGEILKVEICSRQTAPYPMNRIRTAEKIFPKE